VHEFKFLEQKGVRTWNDVICRVATCSWVLWQR